MYFTIVQYSITAVSYAYTSTLSSLGLNCFWQTTENQPTKRHTYRPIAGAHVRCTFFFRLYIDVASKRWFFYEEGVGCCQHVGHLNKHADHVIQPTKNIGQDNMVLVQQLLDAGTAVQSVIAFILDRAGQTLSPKPWKNETEREDALLLSTSPNGSLDLSSMSSADRLLHNLETDPDISYVALLAEHDSALLSTPKVTAKYKRKESHSVEMELTSMPGEVHTVLKTSFWKVCYAPWPLPLLGSCRLQKLCWSPDTWLRQNIGHQSFSEYQL